MSLSPRLDPSSAYTTGVGLADPVLRHDLRQSHSAGLDVKDLLRGEARDAPGPGTVDSRVFSLGLGLEMVETDAERILAEMMEMLPIGNGAVGKTPSHQVGIGSWLSVSGSSPSVAAAPSALPDMARGEVSTVNLNPDLRLPCVVAQVVTTRNTLHVPVAGVVFGRNGCGESAPTRTESVSINHVRHSFSRGADRAHKKEGT